MSNLSYCRRENTLSDLQDCADHLEDGNLNPTEHRARAGVLRLAADMLEQIGLEVDREQLDTWLAECAP